MGTLLAAKGGESKPQRSPGILALLSPIRSALDRAGRAGNMGSSSIHPWGTAMKRILLPAAAIILFSTGAEAISRYTATTMSCARAQSIVASRGEVLFDYRSPYDPGARLFDRFVSSGSYCPRGQYVAGAFIPTADNPYCALQRCIDLTGRGSRGGGGGDGTN